MRDALLSMYGTEPGDSAGTPAARLRRIARRAYRWAMGLPFEALFWTAGLVAMAAMDPQGDHLFSLCPLDAVGVSICPGCGLGHAVAYLARGELVASVQAHPLGVPAVLILATHVHRLARRAGGPLHVHRS
ncbi:MAG: DUF2752 domain-containing protein [Salinibacter sp.]|uniref:DUF2752 domain-containing protein n=1 Tax=Salinibacter sp. TaxID=2065818 RepID=UPI0035D4AE2A